MKKSIDAAIGVVQRGPHVLICQRKAADTFGGYWEFPGGKQEPGETLEACLARELQEELAIGVEVVARLTTIEHDYPHARIRLHPFLCRLIHGEPTAIECDQFQWVSPAALPQYRFPPANESLLREVNDVVSQATRKSESENT